MNLTIEAIYDGKAFLPITPLSMKPATRVRISVLPFDKKTESFLNTTQSLIPDGPPDWSEKLDEYLYGGKKPDND